LSAKCHLSKCNVEINRFSFTTRATEFSVGVSEAYIQSRTSFLSVVNHKIGNVATSFPGFSFLTFYWFQKNQTIFFSIRRSTVKSPDCLEVTVIQACNRELWDHGRQKKLMSTQKNLDTNSYLPLSRVDVHRHANNLRIYGSYSIRVDRDPS
jgi:hypothetical protein